MAMQVEKEFLPIEDFRQEILDAVEKSSAVIITAETGAGKTTQVPQYLAESGFRVVVTQPRRLAATSVAMRVAEEMGVEIGSSKVGYRTAYESCDKNSQILFCTDGLQLVREITGSGRAQVLIIDEVHEWNTNIETLVAWAKKRLAEACNFKVVIMSATLDAQSLAQFFGNCPVIEVPGRLYPVEEKQSMAKPHEEAIRLAKEGRNVLVFQPGKKEIEETILEIKNTMAETAVILPLHGQLEHADQRACFRRYDRPKVIVSTNVAQTSVTIADIDAVVDSGKERRVELVDGIEGLYLRDISDADCKQRAGRAGRTKEGVYILCGKAESRQTFPTAEIQRVRLDQLVLRLAASGFDATELEFFHQPDKATLIEAKRALHGLGAMTEDGKVTKIGHLMAKLPCSVQYARMIVEANRLGVVDDVLTIAAILEVGGLRDRTNAWRQHTQEQSSDLLAELDLWNACRGLQNGELKEMGIFSKAYYRAKEIRYHLSQMASGQIHFGSTGDREAIKKACVAGMVDHLYQKSGYNEYRNGSGGTRTKGRESVVSGNPDWIVGLPKDIQFTNRRGRLCTLKLVSSITAVDPSWLLEVAPQLATTTRRNYSFSTETQAVMCDLVHVFNGQEVKVEKVEAEACLEATNALAIGFASEFLNNEIGKTLYTELAELQAKSAGMTREPLNHSEVTNIYLGRLDDNFTTQQVAEQQIDLTLPRSMFVSDEDANYIRQGNPDTVKIGDEVCNISYQWDRWDKKQTVIIKVSVTTIQKVAQAAVENLTPSGASYQLKLKDENYANISGTDVATLREQIETRRLELVWEIFRKENCAQSVEIKGLEPLPELPEPKIYDEVTNILAFPALQHNSWGEWHIAFFRHEADAQKSQAAAIETKDQLDAKEDERIHFDERVNEARAELNAVNQLFGQIKMEEYSSYGLSDEEAGKSYYRSSESMVNQLEQVKELLPEQSRYAKPAKALELLTTISARVETAFDYKARNAEMETEARQIIDRVKTLNEVRDALADAGDSSLTSEEISKLYSVISSMESMVENSRFLPAVQKAKEANELITKATRTKEILDAQQTSGEILINFTAWHRRGGQTNNGLAWVVRPDGSLREHDSSNVARYKSDGDYTWRRVNADELALRWKCSSLSDVVGNSTFEVVKMPVGGMTDAQAERVAEIEQEIGVPEGSFGLNAGIAERNVERLTLIRAAAAKIVSNPLHEFDYRNISSENGVGFCDDRLMRIYNPHGSFTESCDGRGAQRVAGVAVCGGVLEFLVYNKYGQDNLSIRWRTLRNDEQTPDELSINELSQAADQARYEIDKQYAEQQVAGGYWMQFLFRKGKHPKTGEVQWEAGTKQVKYVLDRGSDREPVEGQSHYVSVGKTLVDTGNFQLIVVRLEPPYPEDQLKKPVNDGRVENKLQAEKSVQAESTEQSEEISLDDLKAKFKRH